MKVGLFLTAAMAQISGKPSIYGKEIRKERLIDDNFFLLSACCPEEISLTPYHGIFFLPCIPCFCCIPKQLCWIVPMFCHLKVVGPLLYLGLGQGMGSTLYSEITPGGGWGKTEARD